MPTLSIHPTTRYRHRREVAFGEHRTIDAEPATPDLPCGTAERAALEEPSPC